jgi:hypothetical protein
MKAPLNKDLSQAAFLSEFAKLLGARALLWHWATLEATRIIKFPGKLDDHPQ